MLPRKDTRRLSRFDWNFDAVPEKEVAACCVWEYARESVSIGCSAKSARDWNRAQITGETLPGKAGLEEFDAVLDPFMESDRVGYWIYPTIFQCGGPASLPWQRIPKKVASKLAHDAEKRMMGSPLMPVEIDVLEQYWQVNLKESQQRGETSGDYRPAETWRRPIYSENGRLGPVIAAFEIDFFLQRDSEIREAFAQWVKESRPKDCPEPVYRGHKRNDLRAALDRLGIMRLLHHHTLREMQSKQPEAWRKFELREWYKERKRAVLAFRTLFPFLRKTEVPLSLPTKGSRKR